MEMWLFDMVFNELKGEMSRQKAKNFVSKIVKKGWLVRIKKGVFIISDIANRGSVGINQLLSPKLLTAIHIFRLKQHCSTMVFMINIKNNYFCFFKEE